MASLPMTVGDLTSIGLANPAAGAEVVYVPATGTRIKIRAMQFVFTTAVAVANRYVWYKLTATPYDTGLLVHPTAQTASLVWTYSLIPGFKSTPYAVGLYAIMPWDPDIQFDPSHRLHIGAVSMQAADQISDITLYIEQWIDD